MKSILSKVQTIVDNTETGHLVLVDLINYDKLVIMFESMQEILEDFYSTIHRICKDFGLDECVQVESNKLLMVFNSVDASEVAKFAFQTYYNTQLYTSNNYPEAFLNCRIASIVFNEKNDANKLYKTLCNMLSNSNIYSYYYPYNTLVDDLAKVKAGNILLNKFRKSIVNREIKFAYQPIIDRANGHVHYYECLLRVPDENGQLVSIGPMISHIEQNGLMQAVDHIVFEMVVNELANDQKLSLSVNISNLGILDEQLLLFAENLLTKNKVAERLIVEITESIINEDYRHTKKFIDRLHKFGCRFALDDFGSGFTSFKQLQNLPIDIIKIDGSYIRDITSNNHSKYFVEALLRISEDLGIKTVAEFVENGEIAKFLIDLKVDGMQGNFFAPALIRGV